LRYRPTVDLILEPSIKLEVVRKNACEQISEITY
jgi:hypothetical protein